jgi:hypothetical protein
LLEDNHFLSKCKVSIEQLLVELKGGVSKKVSADKSRRTLQRRVGDAGLLEAFPTVDAMKLAVTKGMKQLICIKAKYAACEQLPPPAQAEATSIMIGIIWLNGFGGRKMEWEVMTLEHFSQQMAKGFDYLVCDVHKTSHVYGSLAKYLAPGTMAAMQMYASLPRKGGFQYLLVPAEETTARVNVPGYFRSPTLRFPRST